MPMLRAVPSTIRAAASTLSAALGLLWLAASLWAWIGAALVAWVCWQAAPRGWKLPLR